jgi:hypothetical protein
MTYRELAGQYAHDPVIQAKARVTVATALENTGTEEARIAAISGRFFKAHIRRQSEKSRDAKTKRHGKSG